MTAKLKRFTSFLLAGMMTASVAASAVPVFAEENQSSEDVQNISEEASGSTVSVEGLSDDASVSISRITDETLLSSVMSALGDLEIIDPLEISLDSGSILDSEAGAVITLSDYEIADPANTSLYHIVNFQTDAQSVEQLQYSYDADTKTVSFTTASFSPFIFAGPKAQEAEETAAAEENNVIIGSISPLEDSQFDYAYGGSNNRGDDSVLPENRVIDFGVYWAVYSGNTKKLYTVSKAKNLVLTSHGGTTVPSCNFSIASYSFLRPVVKDTIQAWASENGLAWTDDTVLSDFHLEMKQETDFLKPDGTPFDIISDYGADPYFDFWTGDSDTTYGANLNSEYVKDANHTVRTQSYDIESAYPNGELAANAFYLKDIVDAESIFGTNTNSVISTDYQGEMILRSILGYTMTFTVDGQQYQIDSYVPQSDQTFMLEADSFDIHETSDTPVITAEIQDRQNNALSSDLTENSTRVISGDQVTYHISCSLGAEERAIRQLQENYNSLGSPAWETTGKIAEETGMTFPQPYANAWSQPVVTTAFKQAITIEFQLPNDLDYAGGYAMQYDPDRLMDVKVEGSKDRIPGVFINDASVTYDSATRKFTIVIPFQDTEKGVIAGIDPDELKDTAIEVTIPGVTVSDNAMLYHDYTATAKISGQTYLMAASEGIVGTAAPLGAPDKRSSGADVLNQSNNDEETVSYCSALAKTSQLKKEQASDSTVTTVYPNADPNDQDGTDHSMMWDRGADKDGTGGCSCLPLFDYAAPQPYAGDRENNYDVGKFLRNVAYIDEASSQYTVSIEGFAINKQVNGIEGDYSYPFKLTGSSSLYGTTQQGYLESVDADGNSSYTDRDISFNAKGIAYFDLKHNQTQYIQTRPNTEYAVKERLKAAQELVGNTDFVVSVNGKLGSKANGTVGDTLSIVSFANTATGTLEVSKTVYGEVPDVNKNQKFTFHVKFEGNVLPEKVDVVMNGKTKTKTLNDGEITFKLSDGKTAVVSGIPLGTNYTVTEDEAAGYTSVIDNGSGTIDINQTKATVECGNTYNPGDATAEISFNKVLEGREWTDEDSFTFALTPASEEQPVPENEQVSVTKADLEDGTALGTFGTITYTAAGDYSYTIREVVPENAEAGMTYDTSIHNVLVKVTDNGDGTMTSEVFYDGDSNQTVPTFTNTLTPEETPVSAEGSVDIRVKKNLEGRDWKDSDAFTFTLTPVDDAPMGADSLEAIADQNHKSVRFDAIAFTSEDLAGETEKTFVYNLHEEVPEDAVQNEDGTYTSGQMTYSADQKVYVHVKNNGDGTMTITYGSDENGTDQTVAMTNTYTPEEPEESETPEPSKTPETTATPEPTETPEPTKTPETTATPEPTETPEPTNTPETTATPEPTETPEPSKTPETTATPEPTKTPETTATPEPSETPETVAEGSVEISVTKELEGREWKDSDEFTFTLTPVDGAPMDGDSLEVTADQEHQTVSFDAINFTAEDLAGKTEKTFVYNLHEEVPEDAVQNEDGTYTAGQMTYSADQKIYVFVSDNGDDTLSVTYSSDEDEADQEVAVVNTYTPEEPEETATPEPSETPETPEEPESTITTELPKTPDDGDDSELTTTTNKITLRLPKTNADDTTSSQNSTVTANSLPKTGVNDLNWFYAVLLLAAVGFIIGKEYLSRRHTS